MTEPVTPVDGFRDNMDINLMAAWSIVTRH